MSNCTVSLIPVRPMQRLAALALLAASALALQPAHAQLFSDNEARRAILDVRQRYQTLADENTEMRGALQSMQAQIEALRSDLAKTRSREEQLARDVAELQRRQKDFVRPGDDRPGATAAADAAAPALMSDAAHGDEPPQEKAAFDAALNQFRANDYAGAQAALRNYLRKYPQGSRRISALYWLGNSDYALRNYRSAMGSFRSVVNQAPEHERAPEALLSLAACQVELKDMAGARATLEQLILKYPRSEAAQAGRDRLARLR